MSDTVAIVLTYRREALATACVESLQQSSVPLRILLVDNDSGDGSAARLRARFPDVEVLETGHNYHYAGGNRRGIDRALAQGFDRLLVMNDDAAVDSKCVARLNAALDADPQAAAAAPTIMHETPADLIWWAGGRFDALRALGTHERYGERLRPGDDQAAARPATFISGCCVMFRAEALRRHGSFRDEFVIYAEDVELCVRLMHHGWRLLHVPSARAIHKVPFPEGAAVAWKIVLRDRNRRRVAALWFSWPQRLMFYAVFGTTRCALLVRYLLRGDFARARAIVAGALT